MWRARELKPQDETGPRRGRLLALFVRNKRGSVAIEFTLLAIPFLMLVFAILESCISFAAQEVLANATDDVARLMRTGQIKSADITDAKLKQLICDRINYMVSSGCPYLDVDLHEYTTFADAAKVRVKFTSDKDIDTTGFYPAKLGKSMSKNMLRVFYRWPVMLDFMSSAMSNLKGGKTLHFSTVTWQNEPFDD